MGIFVRNLINGYIAYIINAICFNFTPLTSLLSMNGFAYDAVTGMDLYPEMVVSQESAFNWADMAIEIAVVAYVWAPDLDYSHNNSWRFLHFLFSEIGYLRFVFGQLTLASALYSCLINYIYQDIKTVTSRLLFFSKFYVEIICWNSI